ncbi:hypothetical protein [Campylobacter jejuni]|uniref:Uncharacterized protein n=1 Tax=Campylobacter phage CP21 TaxID=2881391 RepID=I7II65_9CAUD|nr:hypothetical protein [Campylobacter jejuni]YP_007005120.1 hypothetical protein F421_gp050 [Campylobacter phage CP21]CCH63512.1 hypothetical protein [Campylobacter phage CP21]
MNLQKVINSLTLKDEPKYAIDVINSNIDILVNDGGMKKHEAIVQVLEDVKMLYRND